MWVITAPTSTIPTLVNADLGIKSGGKTPLHSSVR